MKRSSASFHDLADDLESLKLANPGAAYGIGSSLDWLQGRARRAIARGGSTLTSFRLYNRNERVSGENLDVLLTVDEWLSCETADLPARRSGDHRDRLRRLCQHDGGGVLLARDGAA